MAPAVVVLMIAVLSTPAFAGVDQCLNYADNRSIAACVERENGPVPIRRNAPALKRAEATPNAVHAPEFEGRWVRVVPVSREIPAPPAAPASPVDSTIRSMNPWYFIIPGIVVLFIMLQIAGRAVYGRSSAYVPVGGRRPGDAQAAGAMRGLMGRIASSYRRCPYCGTRARQRAIVCKKCLRALPA